MKRPTCGDAPAVASGRGVEGQGTTDTGDSAHAEAQRKRAATVTARAALLGLVLRPLAGGAWVLLNTKGQETTLQSLQAAEGVVYGCELVRADLAAMVGGMRRAVSCAAAGSGTISRTEAVAHVERA